MVRTSLVEGAGNCLARRKNVRRLLGSRRRYVGAGRNPAEIACCDVGACRCRYFVEAEKQGRAKAVVGVKKAEIAPG